MRVLRLFHLCLAAGLVCFSLCPLTATAEDRWTEIRSPHFRVITDRSAADGRKAAEQFEQMRYVIQWRFPTFRLEGNSPMTVIAASGAATMVRLHPALSGKRDLPDAEFFPSWERIIALLRLDLWDKDSHEPSYYAYMRNVLEVNSEDLPVWMSVGLSEFYGCTRFTKERITVGNQTGYWGALTEKTVVPVGTLIGPHGQETWSDANLNRAFFAESWALIHYLTFGPKMDGGRLLADYYERIQKGEPPLAAFTVVFGDPAVVDTKFQAYLHNNLWTVATIPPAPPLDPSSFVARPLSPAEVLYEQAIVHVDAGDPSGGRTLLEEAVALDSKLGAAHEELGYLNYDDGKDAEARTEWQTASSLDPLLYRSLFAISKTGIPLREQSPDQRKGTLESLRKVVRINPRYAPAYLEIALLFWWQGDLEAAARAVEEAERLEPRRYGSNTLMARLLLAQNKGRQAASILRRAAEKSQGMGRHEVAMLWQQVPPAERGEGSEITFAAPSGVVVQEGSLKSVTCADPGQGLSPTLTLQPAAPDLEPMQLSGTGRAHTGFADTIWTGGRHFSSFSVCRHAVGRPAAIAYKPVAKNLGEIVWVDVREEYPTQPRTHENAGQTSSATPKSSSPNEIAPAQR